MDNVFYCKIEGDEEIKNLINLIINGEYGIVDQLLADGEFNNYSGDEIVYAGIYQCLIHKFDTSCMRKLMEYDFDNFGTCVNGLTMIQNLILFKRKSYEIQTMIKAGLCIDATSYIFKQSVISYLLEKIIEEGNTTTPQLDNLLDILFLFLKMDIGMNNKDVMDLAYVSFVCSNTIKQKELKTYLENLHTTDIRYKQFHGELKDFGEKKIIRGKAYKIIKMSDFFTSDIQRQSMLLSCKNLELNLTSPRIFPSGFKRRFLDQVHNSLQFQTLACEILKKFKKFSNLPEECAKFIFQYLNLEEMQNFQQSFEI